MKIGIDARFLTHPQPGGFKTYTENIIASLAKLDTENEYVLYVDREPNPECNIPDKPNFVSKVVPGLIPLIGMPFREQVELVLQTKKDRVDLFHSPCLTAPLLLDCPLVLTVHDMIWASSRKVSRSSPVSIKRRFMRWYNYFIPQKAIGCASAIITVSNAAREDIQEYLKTEAKRLFVTYGAPSPAFKPIKDQRLIESVCRKYDLPSKYILAIGSADPRKNISRLVQAYSLLSRELRQQYPLVIVWTHMLLEHELSVYIEELQIANDVRFLRNVTNHDLTVLYNIASIFAFPSLYEGFGLPPLEAMACGTPVIASDNSSIPEIVGEAALLFNAQNVGEIAVTMLRVLSDDALRHTLIKKGNEHVNSFSWEKCARETLSVYTMVLSP